MEDRPNKQSAYYVNAAETSGGILDYARTFNMKPDQLEDVTGNNVVMDLGSGPGTYAAEVEYWRDIPGHKSPKRVDSVNVRYAAADYQQFLNDLYGQSGRPQLAQPPNALGRTFISEDEAWEKAKANFKPVDWHDLSELPNEEYGVIISDRGFPFYSDLKYNRPENTAEYEQAIKEGSLVKFGPESRQVFDQVTQKMAPGGIALLTTNFPYFAWDQSPVTQAEAREFFKERGCDVQLVRSMEGPSRTGDNYLKISKHE